MKKTLLLTLLQIGFGVAYGQVDYSIRHSVNYIKNGNTWKYIYYESVEKSTKMSVINNRITQYCDSHSLDFVFDSIPVEIKCTSNGLDTFVIDTVSQLYFMVITGYELVYCSILSSRTVIRSKGNLELYLHDTMPMPRKHTILSLSGDTFDIHTKNNLYIPCLVTINDKLITEDMRIYVDTMEFVSTNIEMNEVKNNMIVNYLLLDDLFYINKTDIQAFKRAIRKVYFKNYSIPTNSLTSYEEDFLAFHDIAGFMKRRRFISRIHLMFRKNKFKQ